MVPCVRVVVQRVYPMVFMETLPDGVKVMIPLLTRHVGYAFMHQD